MLLTLIAWKNVWRNKRRSAIMIAASALGLWGGIFAVGLFTGLYDTMVNSSIDRYLAHLQLHVPGFREEGSITMTIPDADSVVAGLRRIPGVSAVSPRAVIEGMASSPASAQRVSIVGIDPAVERSVTFISRQLTRGTFFEGNGRSPILVGRKLAERLDLKIRSKVVLSFQNPDGTIVYGAFRVLGIFDTESSVFDGVTVFLRETDLAALTGMSLTHEIAVRLATNDSLEAVAARARGLFPHLGIETWKEIAPELKLAESADVTMGIFLGIILLALVFGITNTMLMSVLDRLREFGVLMAVGMKRRRIFAMIVLETLILSVTGSVLGMALGSASVLWTGRSGINLRWFSEGLSMYGMSSMLYPVVHSAMYLAVGLMVIVAGLAAAVYPAIKAIRLNPASAIATFG